MDLKTITEVRRVNGNGDGDEDFDWREGDSWLAGGTWLFSEPQPHLRRLLDLHGFDWEPLVVSEQGLQISPTCTIAELEALEAPPEWTAAPLGPSGLGGRVLRLAERAAQEHLDLPVTSAP